MKILILGRTEILYETAVRMSKHHHICGIITAKHAPEYLKTEEDFKKLAFQLKCPYIFTNRLDETVNKFIQEVRPDIGVSLNWTTVIQQETIGLIPHGILNAHFGDLPRYRGNAVINCAILCHETFVCLTIHFMEPGGLDSGDIIIQRHMPLDEKKTVKDILDFATCNIPEMFLAAVNGIEDGSLQPEKQNTRGKTAFRCFPRLPVDSKIDWLLPAKEIDALIRASTHPYSGAYTYLKVYDQIRKVYIWQSRIVCEDTVDIGSPGHIIKNDHANGESWVFTGKGILAIQKVQYEDGAEFAPGKTWRSIRMRFGIDVEAELMNIYSNFPYTANQLK